MILLITKDLFFVPVLRGPLEKRGGAMVTALSFDSPKVAELNGDDVSVCIIDLSSVAVAQVSTVAAAMRCRFPQTKLVAFGPHVQNARLEAASAAQCDQVLTRGQFSQQIERLLDSWLPGLAR
jgi:hypothetical protein